MQDARCKMQDAGRRTRIVRLAVRTAISTHRCSSTTASALTIYHMDAALVVTQRFTRASRRGSVMNMRANEAGGTDI